MVESYHCDVRTVTLGISLRDCRAASAEETAARARAKIERYAERLVETVEEISAEIGVPIVNKRIAITPLAIVGDGFDRQGFLTLAREVDRAAKNVGVDYIGGYTALVEKGFSRGDLELIQSIPEAIGETERLCSSVNVASTRAGLNLDAVMMMAQAVVKVAERTADQKGIGNSRLVTFCNAVEDNPYVAGAFHGVSEPEVVINVGLSGPGAVLAALKELGPRANIVEVAEAIKKTAFRITRIGELVGRKASQMLGYPFGIVDLSLAPTPELGDSVAEIIEEIGVESTGGPGSVAILALITDAVKKGGAMATSHAGGLSGAFIPVSEDSGMVRAAARGSLSLEMLLAMTSVCSVGMDMIAIPGDTPVEQIAGLIADEMAIGMMTQKTTAVRIMPIPGGKVGDRVEFGGLLGEAIVQEISRVSCARLFSRGGLIPAPLQGLKN